MELTQEERDILDGKQGETLAKVMRTLVEYGEAFGASRMVKVTALGDQTIDSIEIDPAAVDPEDVEMLQDLVISAVNEALRQAEDAMNTSMSALTGGLNIPGL